MSTQCAPLTLELEEEFGKRRHPDEEVEHDARVGVVGAVVVRPVDAQPLGRPEHLRLQVLAAEGRVKPHCHSLSCMGDPNISHCRY